MVEIKKEKVKDPNDVSGMTAQERYDHVRKQHEDQQKPSASPADLRAAEHKVAEKKHE